MKVFPRLFSGQFKILPAAFWHAKLLGINLEGVVGTGPKGHILKSDILFKSDNNNNKNNFCNNTYNDYNKSDNINSSYASLIIDIPPISEDILEKCINNIKKYLSKDVQYKFIPEVGYLQVLVEGGEIEGERVKKLLKVYTNDTRHLLL